MDIFEQLYKNNYVSKKKKKVYYPIKIEEDTGHCDGVSKHAH